VVSRGSKRVTLFPALRAIARPTCLPGGPASMETSHKHSHHPFVEGPVAARAVRRVFIITLALNVAVALAKAGYGYLSGSIALGTDAVHAALDASSNVLALMSLHWAQAPADDGHPYGHRKIEILAALGIGVLIVIGLFELSIAAVNSLIGNREAPQIGRGGFIVVIATIIINFFITRYEHGRGDALGSQLLCADAEHTRSDLYASGAVLVSFVGIRLGWRWADPLGAICVAFFVGRAAWQVFRDTVPTLIDAAVLPPGPLIRVAQAIPGVISVPLVRSRGLRNAAHVELRIVLKETLNVAEAHMISENVATALRHDFPEITDVSIVALPHEQENRQSKDVADSIPSPDRR